MESSALAAILQQAGLTDDDPRYREFLDKPPHELPALVRRLSAGETATAVIRAAASAPSLEARLFALNVVGEMPAVDRALVPLLRPLLRDRRIPPPIQIAAAATLLRTTGPRGGAAARVLRDFAAGYGRLRFLAHERRLRQRLGASGAFEKLCARLRELIPLRCPRCGARHRPVAMIRHLWRRHRRLLVGRQVRSPMTWLDHWAARAQPGDDPRAAVADVTRHLLRRRLCEPAEVETLRTVAAQRRGAVCPHCFAETPLPAEQYPNPADWHPLPVTADGIVGEGIAVRRVRRELQSFIRIELTNRYEEFVEPAARWKRAAALAGLVGPWIALALFLALALPAFIGLLAVIAALTVAAVIYRFVGNQFPDSLADALIDIAWRRVVPLTTPNRRFVARLALASIGRGSAHARAGILATCIAESTDASPAELAPLLALRIEDAEALGHDPAIELAQAVIDTVNQGRPLALVELLLEQVRWRDWPTGRTARLRLAIISRAFGAGLGAWEAVELARAVRSLGDLLNTDVQGLAPLRLIWLKADAQPWRRLGPATTALELAEHPFADEHFAAAPDLLFYVRLAGGPDGRTYPLYLTPRGLVFQNGLQRDGDEIAVRERGRQFEMRFGTQRLRFPYDPNALAQELRAWSHFLFEDWLPQAKSAVGVPDGERLARLLRSKTLVCAECGGLFRGDQPRL